MLSSTISYSQENRYENLYLYKDDHTYLIIGAARKQELIDSRRAEMRMMLDNISQIYIMKHEKYNGLPKEKNDYFVRVTDLLISYASYDLSNGDVWMQITAFYTKHKTAMLLW